MLPNSLQPKKLFKQTVLKLIIWKNWLKTKNVHIYKLRPAFLRKWHCLLTICQWMIRLTLHSWFLLNIIILMMRRIKWILLKHYLWFLRPICTSSLRKTKYQTINHISTRHIPAHLTNMILVILPIWLTRWEVKKEMIRQDITKIRIGIK